jgi:cell division protein FtsB
LSLLQHLRNQFGIAAREVEVHTRMPWHWRLAVLTGLLVLIGAIGAWAYDAGRRSVGPDGGVGEEEVGRLRDQVATMEEEMKRLRAIADSSDSNLQIERTTRDQLSRQVKSLEEENTKLKENLAVFENLARGGAQSETLSLSRLRIERGGVGGRYRYRVLISRQGEHTTREFRGNLQFLVTLVQGGAESAIMIPTGKDDAARFAVSFRNFRTFEGHFDVAPEATVKRVEVRLVQGGTVKASESVTL